jgi:hypothetical protein
MRRNSMMAAAAALITVWIPVSAAEAAGGDRGQAPSARHGVRAVDYSSDRGDPYAYRYEARDYYPYYGSQHWRPAREMLYRYRYRLELPPYAPAWGYPR